MADSASQEETAVQGTEAQDAQGAGPVHEDGDVSGLVKKNQELLSEVKKAKQQLRKLQGEQESAAKKALEEEKKYQQLYMETERELNERKSELMQMKRKSGLRDAISKAGMDPDVMPVIEGQIEFDEEDKPIFPDNYFEELKGKKPSWFIDQNVSIPATDSNKAKIFQGGSQRFTRAQISDPEFFAAHQVEILKAVAEGRVT